MRMARKAVSGVAALALTGCSTVYTKLDGGMGVPYAGTRCAVTSLMEQDYSSPMAWMVGAPMLVSDATASLTTDTATLALDAFMEPEPGYKCRERGWRAAEPAPIAADGGS